MESIKVVIQGILGKMGQEVLEAVSRETDMHPIGGSDQNTPDRQLIIPNQNKTISISGNLNTVISGADVVVDFTDAEGAISAIRTAPIRNVNVVIGSTGIPKSALEEADSLANEYGVGIMIAPNFAMGAVLMTHLAKLAGRFFEYADLTETHHENKIDAPSGTAIAIAKAISDGKDTPFVSPKAQKELVPGTRGGNSQGVTIHSARMPGRVAHHELVFGGLGQTLTIRHDSINRGSFMPGVMMAIRHVAKHPGLVIGLDKIMGL